MWRKVSVQPVCRQTTKTGRWNVRYPHNHISWTMWKTIIQHLLPFDNFCLNGISWSESISLPILDEYKWVYSRFIRLKRRTFCRETDAVKHTVILVFTQVMSYQNNWKFFPMVLFTLKTVFRLYDVLYRLHWPINFYFFTVFFTQFDFLITYTYLSTECGKVFTLAGLSSAYYYGKDTNYERSLIEIES